MPRGFNVGDGFKLDLDDENLEFASTHEARVEASRALAEMIKDAMPSGWQKAMTIEVRRGRGQPVFKVQITFEVEPLGDPLIA